MHRVVAAVVLCAMPLSAQQVAGFTPAAAAREVALEAQLRAMPDTAIARRHSHELAGQSHVAGTPRQVATADYVLRQMAGWGLDTMRTTYRVFMPFQDSSVVELVTPAVERLRLEEPPVPGDPTSSLPQWPTMNGYSGTGDVTAGVVYVNYGLPVDYRLLDSLGVSVTGRVVIARYGRSFRGIKAREAEAHGARALLLYSDPSDDGYTVGEVYPDGPMRNAAGVQRGSLLNGEGDPSTPLWPSVEGARRIAEAEMAVPHIPVVPMGYGNAAKILGRLGGASVPNPWQGGLGFRYHLGDGALQLRVAVWGEHGEAGYKTIVNTVGVLRGARRPDELVIIGGHRDAWGPGAEDNVSGTISVLEAARAWGAAAAAGRRPARTLMFATWDAEEWGLIGSTEWVEQMADTLEAKAVAYLNQDMIATGRAFGAGGSVSLQALVRDVARTITQPGDTVTVYQAWTSRSGNEPKLGDLGGGSDFMGFYTHLGIPAVEWGFGGRGGVYHSAYDTWSFVERFADPGYLSQRAVGQFGAVLMARLANADVAPFNYADLGGYLDTLVERTRRETGSNAIGTELDQLADAARSFGARGGEFLVARDRALASGAPAAAFDPANALLRQVERQLVRPGGLEGRPWIRNLVFASDRDNGYANVQFPTIVEALRAGNIPGARAAATELRDRVDAAADFVMRATAALP